MNRVKQIRSTLNMSQKEFAANLGVSQQTLSGVETDTRPLTDHTIKTICSVFGVSEEWLRTGEGDMFPPLSEEDDELTEWLARYASDDIPTIKKRIILETCRSIDEIPDDEIDGLCEILDRLFSMLKKKRDGE